MKVYMVFEHTRHHPKFIKAFLNFNEAIDFISGMCYYIEDHIVS